MLGYVKYNQPYVTWHPPAWPVEREIALGRAVAMRGKRHFRQQFHSGRWLPRADSDSTAAAEIHTDGERAFTMPSKARAKQPKSKIASTIIALVILGVGAAFALRVVLLALISGLILGVIIYLWYLTNLGLAVMRYDRWLSKCLTRYRDAL